VIFFVEREYRTIRRAYAGQKRLSYGMQMLMHRGNTRVSGSSVHFFSPSPSRNNSNLSQYLALLPQALCIRHVFYYPSQIEQHFL
jgi:hypothetical protein